MNVTTLKNKTESEILVNYKSQKIQAYMYESFKSLNIEERILLHLYYWESTEISEIAQFINLKYSATERVLNSALKKLRTKIEFLKKQELAQIKELKKCS